MTCSLQTLWGKPCQIIVSLMSDAAPASTMAKINDNKQCWSCRCTCLDLTSLLGRMMIQTTKLLVQLVDRSVCWTTFHIPIKSLGQYATLDWRKLITCCSSINNRFLAATFQIPVLNEFRFIIPIAPADRTDTHPVYQWHSWDISVQWYPTLASQMVVYWLVNTHLYLIQFDWFGIIPTETLRLRACRRALCPHWLPVPVLQVGRCAFSR